ncbi:hypothetical protein [Streptosporangium vulgare]|uniref:hypothetical protein n=1 Tax=Streptosporangium vulgare TaxID=46190 RepID=UPI0031D9C765
MSTQLSYQVFAERHGRPAILRDTGGEETSGDGSSSELDVSFTETFSSRRG